MDFSFLKNLNESLIEPVKAKKEPVVYPIEGDFRVKHNGTIIFSDEFRERVGGKWIDIIFSDEWFQYPKENPACAFIIINDEEKPLKADIKAEGKLTYLTEKFVPKAQEFWGFDFQERGFVDFKIEPKGAAVKIALIPKVVARGEAKGSPDYTRRENVILFPFTPVLDESTQEETEE